MMNRRLSAPWVKSSSLVPFIAICLTMALAVWTRPAYAQSTLSTNWSSLSGTTTSAIYGANDEMCDNYATNNTGGPLDPGYSTAMASIGIGFLRIHNAGLASTWCPGTTINQTLVADEYNAAYVNAAGGANTIQTIGEPPAYCINGDGTINATKYASFCAALVKMINVTLGKHVKYWEIDNEWNSPGYGSGSADFSDTPAFFSLYNQCVVAMKAVDSTIKVGGPTSSWDNYGEIDDFLNNCWANVDFISWHFYYAGGNFSGGDSAYQAMYDATEANGGTYATIDDDILSEEADIASKQGTPGFPAHTILVAQDEYNIPADYSYTGWNQQGYIGATFDAGMFIHFAQDGLNIGTTWSAKDNDIYGLINDDSLLPPATVFQWANSSLIGSMAATTTSDPTDVQILAIDRGAGASGNRYSFLITNYHKTTQTITLTHGLPVNETATVQIIDSGGVHAAAPLSVTGSTLSLSLGKFACALVTMPGSGGGGGSGGSLTGSGATASGTVNLTTQGTSDWAQWGYDGTTVEHDSSGSSQIASTLPTGSTQYTNNGVGYTWTNGTPTAHVTNSTTGVYISNGTFTVTAPATTTSHTLKIYVGGWESTAKITASLSDGSAANYTASASNSSGSYYEVYTLTYKAASAGQTLTVNWAQTAGSGNVTLQAATLQ